MSTQTYLNARAKVEQKLAQYGRVAHLVRQGDSTTGESEPWRPQRDAPDKLEVRILETSNSLTHAPETVIQRGDIFGIMSAAGAVPDELRDRLVDMGKTYEFVEVKPIQPGTVSIMYEFHARR